MTLPAVSSLGGPRQPTAQRLVVVFGDDCIHRNGNVGYGTGEELFTDELTPNDRIGLGILSVCNEPCGVGKKTFAVRDFAGLNGRVIPVDQGIIEKARNVFSGHEIAPVSTVHVERSRFLLSLVQPGSDAGHGFLEQLQARARAVSGLQVVRVDGAHLDFPEKLLVLAKLLQVEVLPVGILEVFIDALDAVGSGLHAFVVSIVKNIEFFGSEEFFENIPVLLEKMSDELIGFAKQAGGGRTQSVQAKALLVLENGYGLGVTEELPEKAQFPDRHIGHVLPMVLIDQNRINQVMTIPPFEHPDNFPAVVLACIEPSLRGRLGELLVRALIGKRIGDGVAGIPGRKHPATVLVGLTVAELLPIDEFAGEHDGLDQLLDRLEVTELGDV